MLTGLLRLRRNVRRQQADHHQALDVAHGVPPPRAAPPVLRRVVLNCWAHCVGDYHCGHAASSSGVGVLGARVGVKCLVSARREYAIFCGDTVNKPCPRTCCRILRLDLQRARGAALPGSLNDGTLTTVLCQHLLAGIASVVWHTRCIAAMLLRGACLPAACAVPRPRKARQPERLH